MELYTTRRYVLCEGHITHSGAYQANIIQCTIRRRYDTNPCIIRTTITQQQQQPAMHIKAEKAGRLYTRALSSCIYTKYTPAYGKSGRWLLTTMKEDHDAPSLPPSALVLFNGQEVVDGVTSEHPLHPPLLEDDDPGAEVGKEAPVVAGGDHAPLEVLERRRQRRHRLHVEVVGRLIHHEHVRRRPEHYREGRARLLAPRELRHRLQSKAPLEAKLCSVSAALEGRGAELCRENVDDREAAEALEAPMMVG